MHVFKKKKNLRSLLSSPIIVILLFVLMIFLLKSTLSILNKVEVSKSKRGDTLSELEALSKRRDILLAKADYLKTGEGIETEIRRKYRFVKEGENIAVIVDKKSDNNQLDILGRSDDQDKIETKKESKDSRSWIQDVINFFSGKDSN